MGGNLAKPCAWCRWGCASSCYIEDEESLDEVIARFEDDALA